MEDWSEDEFEEEDLHGVPVYPDVDVTNTQSALIRLWLQKARENIRNPVLADWVSHINETTIPRDVLRPAGFRQRSQFIAAASVMDRMTEETGGQYGHHPGQSQSFGRSGSRVGGSQVFGGSQAGSQFLGSQAGSQPGSRAGSQQFR